MTDPQRPTPSSGDAWPWPDPQAPATSTLVAEHATETGLGAPLPPASTPPQTPRRGVPRAVVALVAVLSLLIGMVLGLVLAPQFGIESQVSSPEPDAVPSVPSTLPSGEGSGSSVTSAGVDIAGIAAQALPSTVSIETVLADGTGSTGSGLVLREDGYLLTNAHVVAIAEEGEAQITVVFSDGSESAAEIVGVTHDYDLAVLTVDRSGLEPLVLGDSDELVVGMPVVAVGAPLGLEGTVTSGIVSALNRPVQAGDASASSYINAIQTDAAINPGNSGGPLLNAGGEVIGINSAIAQATGSATGNIGLGFAIPSNQARRTAEQLIANGYATYPVIGVLLDSTYTGEGVKVSETGYEDTPALTPGGPAETAGIAPGDVIVALNGEPMTAPDELIVAIRAHSPGEEITLTIRDGGTDREVAVVLGEERSQ